MHPGLGCADDGLGNGKTALKVNVGRSGAGGAAATARNNNPVQTSITSTTRLWNDLNHDFVPDCDLANPFANGECEKLANLSFAQPNVLATHYDPSVLNWWGKRDYNWNVSSSIQHDVLPGLSFSAAY